MRWSLYLSEQIHNGDRKLVTAGERRGANRTSKRATSYAEQGVDLKRGVDY